MLRSIPVPTFIRLSTYYYVVVCIYYLFPGNLVVHTLLVQYMYIWWVFKAAL